MTSTQLVKFLQLASNPLTSCDTRAIIGKEIVEACRQNPFYRGRTYFGIPLFIKKLWEQLSDTNPQFLVVLYPVFYLACIHTYEKVELGEEHIQSHVPVPFPTFALHELSSVIPQQYVAILLTAIKGIQDQNNVLVSENAQLLMEICRIEELIAENQILHERMAELQEENTQLKERLATIRNAL